MAIWSTVYNEAPEQGDSSPYWLLIRHRDGSLERAIGHMDYGWWKYCDQSTVMDHVVCWTRIETPDMPGPEIMDAEEQRWQEASERAGKGRQL